MSMNEELARIQVQQRLQDAQSMHILASARADQPARPGLRQRLSDGIGIRLVRAGEWCNCKEGTYEAGLSVK